MSLVRILASKCVPFRPTTVQMPNLALMETKRKPTGSYYTEARYAEREEREEAIMDALAEGGGEGQFRRQQKAWSYLLIIVPCSRTIVTTVQCKQYIVKTKLSNIVDLFQTSYVWADLIGYLVTGTVVGTNGVAAHMLAPAVVGGTLVLNICSPVIFTERNSQYCPFLCLKLDKNSYLSIK